jgi:hypothetical protein
MPHTQPPRSWFPYRLRNMVLEVLVALSLAFLVWLYTRSRDQEILDQVNIPVEIQLAPTNASNYDLEINGKSRVAVSFTGPPSRIRELRRKLQRRLIQVAVTLSVPEERQNDASYRDSVRIEAANIPVPPGVMAIVADEGNTIPYTVHRLAERLLPVRLDYAGEARLSQVKVEPATVMVRGPKDILDRIWSLSTQPYVMPSPPAAVAGNTLVRGEVSLVNELEGRPLQVTPKSVSFSFHVKPKQRVFELKDVPVHFLCPPNFSMRPGFAPEQPSRIKVRIQGPAAEEAPPIRAFVDLTSGNFSKGRNLEPVRLQLPKEFQPVEESPLMIGFVLEANE